MAEIKVADVSRWQGVIDWDRLKNQVDAVIIKVSGADGGLYTDGQFARNRDEARRVNIPRFYYHYKGAGVSGADQAQYMLAAIGSLQPGEGIVLDDENEASVNSGVVIDFNNKVKDLIGQGISLGYSNQARFTGNLQPIKDAGIKAWVARYGLNDGTANDKYRPVIPILDVAMWQYTSVGHLEGISGNVDLSLFYGDVDEFISLGAKSNTPAPVPPVAQPAPTPAPVTLTYTVTSRDFDGLAAAMRRIGISDWAAVAKLNNLTAPYVIKVGQQLKLKAPVTAPIETGTYVVKSTDRDGLAAAMARIGITNWRAVADHNNLKAPYTIYVGQTLRLPGGTPSTNSTRATYTVKKTDSDGLAAAMKRIGVSDWKRVASLNGLKAPYTIKVGVTLYLN